MNKSFNENLSGAVKKMVPEDMYSRIEADVVPANERTILMNTTEKTTVNTKKKAYKWIAAAIAACIVLTLGVFGGVRYSSYVKVDSIIDIDVNPSIELKTNKSDKVLEVNAVNDDAKAILDGMKLKNTELKVAVNAIIGSMVQHGYLKGDSSILVTVQNSDTTRAEHTKELILSDINESLKSNNAEASVLNQTVCDTSAAKTLAEVNKISIGKAVFILNLCAKDSSLNPDELAKMSIKEISELVTKKNIDISDIVEYDSDDTVWENIGDAVEDVNDAKVEESIAAAANTQISVEKAKQIALEHAGLSSGNVSSLTASLDTDDGKLAFEVEFISGNFEYDYEIDANTGKVLKVDKEPRETKSTAVITTAPGNIATPTKQQTAAPTKNITADEAKAIAFKHAGVTSSSAKNVQVKLDNDDGKNEYDVDFTAGSYEYDYEIDAATGKVLSAEKEKNKIGEIIGNITIPVTEKQTVQPDANTKISLSEAKEIALKNAGLSASAVQFTKAALVNDDGKTVYDIEFISGNKEYEYEIDPSTGSVLDWDSEAI